MKAQYGGNIHTRTGIAASSISMPQFFRFCPDCNEEDERNYGEIYWHRIHQTTGVLVCPYHGVPLHNSTVSFQSYNRHEYHASSPENCPTDETLPDYSPRTLEILTRIAQGVAWLYRHPQPPRSLDRCRQLYLTRLIDRGLATASRRVHQKRLTEEFLFLVVFSM